MFKALLLKEQSSIQNFNNRLVGVGDRQVELEKEDKAEIDNLSKFNLSNINLKTRLIKHAAADFSKKLNLAKFRSDKALKMLKNVLPDRSVKVKEFNRVKMISSDFGEYDRSSFVDFKFIDMCKASR